MAKLTDRIIKSLTPPESGNRIHYDGEIPGFGVRITAAGAKAFIMNFRTAGRERRMTLGSYPAWTLVRARQRAAELRRMIDNGVDPLGAAQDKRAAPTMADLCQRFEEQHLPKCRPLTQKDYRRLIARDILPALGPLKVEDITYSDVDALHRKITRRGATYLANRAVAVLAKMFSLAIKWKMRPDNPAKGIERNQEAKRQRFLSGDELARLSKALAEHDDGQAADIIRLLLLTGARRGEVQAMRWDQLNLDKGVWTKPASMTKQAAEHRIPMPAAALIILRARKAEAENGAVYVFPSHGKTGHRIELKSNWARICKAAGIAETRIHDLRHTFASVLASAGLSLPIIGALLGHSQPATTHRYAHLLDDALRTATERASAVITGKPSAEIVELKGRA